MRRQGDWVFAQGTVYFSAAASIDVWLTPNRKPQSGSLFTMRPMAQVYRDARSAALRAERLGSATNPPNEDGSYRLQPNANWDLIWDPLYHVWKVEITSGDVRDYVLDVGGF